jgi:hypothetical protein
MQVLSRCGSNHWNSKLTADDVRTLLDVHDEYMKLRKEAKAVSPEVFVRDHGYVNTDIYYDIVNHRHRPRISRDFKAKILWNERKRQRIKREIKKLAPKTIAPKFGISEGYYREIASGRYWSIIEVM